MLQSLITRQPRTDLLWGRACLQGLHVSGLAMLLMQAHAGARLVASHICTAYTAAASWLGRTFSSSSALRLNRTAHPHPLPRCMAAQRMSKSIAPRAGQPHG